MWKLKGCPRCGGDLFLERDWYGWYEQCLQCSYRGDLESIIELRERVGKSKEFKEVEENIGWKPN